MIMIAVNTIMRRIMIAWLPVIGNTPSYTAGISFGSLYYGLMEFH